MYFYAFFRKIKLLYKKKLLYRKMMSIKIKNKYVEAMSLYLLLDTKKIKYIGNMCPYLLNFIISHVIFQI